MRGPRLVIPGAIYHLTNRGNKRAVIFSTREEFLNFQERLATAVERFAWRLHAYALLHNHMHLLVELTSQTLSEGMQWLTSGYSVWRNLRMAQSGHVFQGRFKSRICQRESYLLELVRYIHMNPVRARLAVEPGEWPWSSHRVYMGRAQAAWVTSADVLERFGPSGDVNRLGRYEEFVGERATPSISRRLAHTARGTILGDEAFIERVKRSAGLAIRQMDRAIAARPALESVAAHIAELARVSAADFVRRDLHPRIVEARMSFIRLAVRSYRYRAVEVARFLGRSKAAISLALSRSESAFGTGSPEPGLTKGEAS